MPAKLSVNINKYALLRNSRGRDAPSLCATIDNCVAAGAHGITVHPRLDQRHIRLDDLAPIAAHMAMHHPQVELNIECEDASALIDRVIAVAPAQCTLVPVTPGEVTSDHGWDLPAQAARLAPSIERLRTAGVRVSAFADPDPEAMSAFAAVGVDRVELYTGPYAWAWGTDAQGPQTERIWAATTAAADLGLGVNAGHDLDQHNLAGLRGLALDEVSIGHAQICRALDVGTLTAIGELLTALGW